MKTAGVDSWTVYSTCTMVHMRAHTTTSIQNDVTDKNRHYDEETFVKFIKAPMGRKIYLSQ